MRVLVCVFQYRAKVRKQARRGVSVPIIWRVANGKGAELLVAAHSVRSAVRTTARFSWVEVIAGSSAQRGVLNGTSHGGWGGGVLQALGVLG